MAFTRVVGVDQNYNFPPQVREAFGSSSEFLDALTELLQQPAPLPAVVNTVLNELLSEQAQDPASDLFELIREQVIDAMTVSSPGSVQDFAESYEVFQTTNTSFASVAPTSIVPGLDLSVAGTGRPVELIFFCGIAVHSVAHKFVVPYLISSIDGGADGVTIPRLGAVSSPLTTSGRGLFASWDVPTEIGSSYTFKVGLAAESAGTASLLTSNVYPMTFKARNH